MLVNLGDICIQMLVNLADILQKLVENVLLCVARENLRLKNSFIYTKKWLSASKITKTRKLQHIFSI